MKTTAERKAILAGESRPRDWLNPLAPGSRRAPRWVRAAVTCPSPPPAQPVLFPSQGCEWCRPSQALLPRPQGEGATVNTCPTGKRRWRWGGLGTRPEGEVQGTRRSASLVSEGFLEEVTFRLRSEVRAGQEMNTRKSASGREKRNRKGPGVEERERETPQVG